MINTDDTSANSNTDSDIHAETDVEKIKSEKIQLRSSSCGDCCGTSCARSQAVRILTSERFLKSEATAPTRFGLHCYNIEQLGVKMHSIPEYTRILFFIFW